MNRKYGWLYMRSNLFLTSFSVNEKPRVHHLRDNARSIEVTYSLSRELKKTFCMTRESFGMSWMYLNNGIQLPRGTRGSVGARDAYRDRLFSFRCAAQWASCFPFSLLTLPYFVEFNRIPRDDAYTLNVIVRKNAINLRTFFSNSWYNFERSL